MVQKPRRLRTSEMAQTTQSTGLLKKDVDEWFATSYLTEGSKKPEKSKFNSFVPTGPLHVIQVDLFKYSFNQLLDKDDLTTWKKQPPPYGLIGIDTFTKKFTWSRWRPRQRLTGRKALTI